MAVLVGLFFQTGADVSTQLEACKNIEGSYISDAGSRLSASTSLLHDLCTRSLGLATMHHSFCSLGNDKLSEVSWCLVVSLLRLKALCL